MLGNNQANFKAVITADDQASRVLKNVGSNTQKMSSRMKVALLGAGAALTKFGVDSVRAFQDSEDAIAQTNAVLRSTKGVAGVTAEQVDKLAKSWQNNSKYSDESVRSAENMLLTFTNINSKIFPQTLQATLDISTALGQDLKSSAIQVGKALQDPILGVTALRRVGVNFSADQREVIKKLVETGQSAKAQQLILKELNTEFGNSAKAAGETLSGQLAKAKNRFNDLQEQIGATMAQALIPLLNFLAKHPITIKIFTGAVLGLAAAFIAVKTAAGVKGAYGAILTLVNFVRSKAALGAFGPLGLAAMAAAKVIVSAANKARRAWDNTAAAIESAGRSNDAATQKVLDAMRAGKISKAEASRIIASFGTEGVTHRASGGPVTANTPYMVGEHGQELFVPKQSGTIVPNDKLGTGIFNFNVNIGMYAGSEIEKRKVARELFNAYQEWASSRGMA